MVLWLLSDSGHVHDLFRHFVASEWDSISHGEGFGAVERRGFTQHPSSNANIRIGPDDQDKQQITHSIIQDPPRVHSLKSKLRKTRHRFETSDERWEDDPEGALAHYSGYDTRKPEELRRWQRYATRQLCKGDARGHPNLESQADGRVPFRGSESSESGRNQSSKMPRTKADVIGSH